MNRIDRLGLWFDDLYQIYQGNSSSLWALAPNVPQPVSDFVAGFGDTLTSGFGLTYLFGLPSGTEAIRGLWEEAFDLPNVVDPCSKSYKAGKYGAYAWGVAFGGALAAKAAGYEVVFWRYPNAHGIGMNILKQGDRIIGFDWHRFKSLGEMVNRLHIDIPGKIKHWPWPKK